MSALSFLKKDWQQIFTYKILPPILRNPDSTNTESSVWLVNILLRKFDEILKVHYCRFENLSLRSNSYKNNILKILHSYY